MKHKASESLTQLDWRSTLQSSLLLTAGALLLAVTVDLFLAPSTISPGGVSGSAILINHFTRWPIGLTILFCTVNRPDVNAVRAILDEVDPEAFVVIGHGHQASGGMLRAGAAE